MTTATERAILSLLENDFVRHGSRFTFRGVTVTVHPDRDSNAVIVFEWLTYSSARVLPEEAGRAAIALISQATADAENPGDCQASSGWEIGDQDWPPEPGPGRTLPHFVTPISGLAAEWLGSLSAAIVDEVMEFYWREFTRERATEVGLRFGLPLSSALEVGGYMMRWKRARVVFPRVPLVFSPGNDVIIAEAGGWAVAHITGAPSPLILCRLESILPGHRIKRFIVWWLITGSGAIPHATIELTRRGGGQRGKDEPELNADVWDAILDAIVSSPERFGIRRWDVQALTELLRAATGKSAYNCAQIARKFIKEGKCQTR